MLTHVLYIFSIIAHCSTCYFYNWYRLLRMESNDVRVIGIYGLGGVGKTTIAKAICNELCYKFENISDIECLSPSQHHLISDILREERSQNIKSDSHGSSLIKTIFHLKEFLLFSR